MKSQILDHLSNNEVVQEILSQGEHIGNLFEMEEALVLASAFRQDHKTRIIIKNNRYQAQQCFQRLEPLVDDVLLFVMEESLRVQSIASSPEDNEQMLYTLTQCVLDPKPRLIICNVAAFLKFLPDVDVFRTNCFKLEVDQSIEMNTLKERLNMAGYSKVNYVDRPCTYASRGGIIDVYTLQYEHPIRIEFFDTDIESIRFFDEQSQRTIESISSIQFGPASDLLFTQEQRDHIHSIVQETLEKETKKLSEDQSQYLQDYIEADLRALDSFDIDPRLYWYFSFVSPKQLLDYVDGIVIFSSQEEVENYAKQLNEENIAFMQEMVQDARWLPKYMMFHDIYELEKKHTIQMFHQFLDYQHPIESHIQSIERVDLPLSEIIMNIHNKNVYFALDQEQRTRIQPMLEEVSFSYEWMDPIFYEGFSYENFAVYTAHELFSTNTIKKRFKKSFKEGQILSDVLDLHPNDYVVHEQYGIGQYLGIVTRNVQGKKLDYLHVMYRDGGDLYVPLSQFQLVRKYVSKEGVGIQLSKLGSDQWKKTKEKVNKRVEKIAKELVNLYAARNQNIGFAFSPDDALQREFDEAFEFESTPDQIQATAQIKAEMEKSKPMDHLLCGDVGFGKTEVAMRVAFKAIANGKQVAVLCPTTILSMQHFQTFTKRFENVGVNIGLINRFETSKNIKKVKEGLANGSIDIVIGTHKLLNKTYQFKDLGLLIVDEEQRFGVTHKERIKQMKNSVDVLSLSATPIPRTLQMSLIGVRTISQLNTPPAQRHPIQTYVMEKRGSVVKEIIQRELSRNGQVFYLYNNVERIYEIAKDLQRQFPDTKIAIAHGRMNREDIEHTMIDFQEQKYQIMVCTTIIETGLDIANANTIIIENADRFGLSQLYQIRGRVGRREKIAYCYLMVQPHKELSEQASKRLKSIKEFTSLGSGYKIAMRDLTIRGAGDLLGPQQAGFIDQVGLDLYLEMLANAIAKEKGENIEPKSQEKVADVQMSGYIPQNFTDNDGDKLSLYQDIKKVRTYSELDAYQQKIEDLYGTIPNQVQQLFERKRMDLFVNEDGVDSLIENDTRYQLTMSEHWTKHCDGVKLFETMNKISKSIDLRLKAGKIEITWMKKKNSYDLLNQIMSEIVMNGDIYETR